MSDPLAVLFDQFLKERIYLKAVSPKTEVRYRTAFKAWAAKSKVWGRNLRLSAGAIT
jgi:hypothetical protein